MRYSKQRERIHRFVRESREHPTAQMVYDALREETPKLSLGTVYRDLNQLVEVGALIKIPLPDGGCRYDSTVHTHGHIVCDRCGAVGDIEMQAKRLSEDVETQTGFSLSSLSFVANGVCPECRRLKTAE